MPESRRRSDSLEWPRSVVVGVAVVVPQCVAAVSLRNRRSDIERVRFGPPGRRTSGFLCEAPERDAADGPKVAAAGESGVPALGRRLSVSGSTEER